MTDEEFIAKIATVIDEGMRYKKRVIQSFGHYIVETKNAEEIAKDVFEKVIQPLEQSE